MLANPRRVATLDIENPFRAELQPQYWPDDETAAAAVVLSENPRTCGEWRVLRQLSSFRVMKASTRVGAQHYL